ncbi:MAG: hypothetical protein M3Y43_03275, partial [Pseudomonadota bacterium]|nr:hypothetical protein [Pseudomonadota bacterium]
MIARRSHGRAQACAKMRGRTLRLDAMGGPLVSVSATGSITHPSCLPFWHNVARLDTQHGWRRHDGGLTRCGFAVNGRLMSQADAFEIVLEIRARAVEDLLAR